jgi:hypothetical protein
MFTAELKLGPPKGKKFCPPKARNFESGKHTLGGEFHSTPIDKNHP